MNPIKPNTKIKILSLEHQKEIQNLAKSAGVDLNLIYVPNSWVNFSKDGTTLVADWCAEDKFLGSKEIFIDLPSANATNKPTAKHSHYFKDVSDLDEVDVYRVCDLFEVNDHSGSIQHALKKLLCSGQRGVKCYRKDLEEARDSIQRKLDMMAEDGE